MYTYKKRARRNYVSGGRPFRGNHASRSRCVDERESDVEGIGVGGGEKLVLPLLTNAAVA